MFFNKKCCICLMIFYEIISRSEFVEGSKKLGQGRTLIFPPTTPTRLQFICGIGIPVEDLHSESVTSGYVLKAEYFLPSNASQLHLDYLKPQNISRRDVLDDDGLLQSEQTATYNKTGNQFQNHRNDLSTYRWTIYKAMETLGDRMGLVGRACVLKSICESASAPFHHASGILAEIAHIVMTPSSSVEKLNHYSNNEYLHAEMLGRKGAACTRVFTECRQSFLEQISKVFRFSRNVFHNS